MARVRACGWASGLLALGVVSACTTGPVDGDSGDGDGDTEDGDGGTGDGDGDGDGDTGDGDGDTGDGDGDGDGDSDIPGLALLQGLAGLWSGPAAGPMQQLVFGFEPTMIMDIRAVDDRHLFCRADLDVDNNLRFLFSIEDHGDGPELVYRNGGFFQGILRDSRTRIDMADEAMGVWRFCSIDQGCGYIDALFELDGDTLSFDAMVQGGPHVFWQATRVEARPLPGAFPADLEPGAADQPFPPLPRAEVTATWSAAVTYDSQLLLAISVNDCPLNPFATCNYSRSYVKAISAGATSATLPIEQLHPGSYAVNAVLDVDGDNTPDLGEYIAVPNQDLVVPADPNATAPLSVSVTVPIQF